MSLAERRTRPVPLDAILRPKSIAVIGASPDYSSYPGRPIKNLERNNYPGIIYPVNPKYPQVGRWRCYEHIEAVAGPVEAAVITLQARMVPDTLHACGRKGVQVVTICSAGFGELGEDGVSKQQELRAIAEQYDMRLIGPNCVGVSNKLDSFVPFASLSIFDELVPGHIAFLSQSGASGVTIFNRAQSRGIGFRALISVGNEADLEISELIEAFLDDPHTRVFALFVEGLKNGPNFVRVARRAFAEGKPIVALKVAKSARGQEMARGHTGSMAGNAGVYAGIFRQCGVVEVDSFTDLYSTAHALASLQRPRGNRLGAVTISGGEGGYVADLAEKCGLAMPPLSPGTKAELASILRFGNPNNPLDPTGQVIGSHETFKQCIEIFCRDPSFDMISLNLCTLGAVDAEKLTPALSEAANACDKPTVISAWTAGPMTVRTMELLHRDCKVPVYESSNDAVNALEGLYRYTAFAGHVQPTPPPVIGTALASPVGAAGGALAEYQAKAILGQAGLPVTREVLARTPEEALAAFRAMGTPAALKVQSAAALHKTELNLVQLGVQATGDVAGQFRRLVNQAGRQGIEPDGVLVQEMVAGFEVIVGAMNDAAFGPMIMVGAGGIYAELLKDTAFRLCPISPAEADEMLRGLRIYRILSGARGRAYDTEALVRLLVDFSQFVAANADWILECDLNPVMVGRAGAGLKIVDALITTRR